MVPVLLLVMIAIPIIEIGVFIEVGGWIGLWPTLTIVILTAIAGTTLLRLQGLATLFRAQENLSQGIFPIAEVFDGLCLLFAGALLLTPGFVTDAVGLLLFVPAVRAAVKGVIARHLRKSGKIHVKGFGESGPRPPEDAGFAKGPTIIDTDYEDITDTTDRR